MKKPNFFGIGAPKCGTTSLYEWLKQHPQIFVPEMKEPHYFNSDDYVPGRLTFEQYESLFADATDDHPAVGEVSVWYLASSNAVPAILDYNPDAKLIACVRNPIEMAYALHHQQVFAGNETIANFRDAWHAQPGRMEPNGRPAAQTTHLLYGPMCKLGEQLDRLYRIVPRERVHVMFMDDMKSDPARAYGALLGFLGVPPHMPDFQPSNEAKVRKSHLLRRLVNFTNSVKKKSGIKYGFGLLQRIDKWNRKPRRWVADPDMANVLRSYFSNDIALLGNLTGRDLSHWLDADVGQGR